MPRIINVQTAVPAHKLDQADARIFVQSLFAESELEVDRLLPIFEHTEVAHRYFCQPKEWFAEAHSFSHRNREYIRNAISLAETAISKALTAAGLTAEEIGHVIFVSSTGLSTPSIDAYLFNRLRFHHHVRRTPIWGLGCAGGVAGINRANDWLRAYPDEIALVVAVELCGLTFIRNDLSKPNFVATSLFGDGCGVALLAGDNREKSSPLTIELLANSSTTWDDSLAVMGWDINDDGLKVVFSHSIPAIVQDKARVALLEFLQSRQLQIQDIDFFLSHPGGAKVIQAYQQSLGLTDRQIQHMRDILRDFGNMSSATVFFVLKSFLNSPEYEAGANILTTALGPGFSTEMFLGVCH